MQIGLPPHKHNKAIIYDVLLTKHTDTLWEWPWPDDLDIQTWPKDG